MTTSLLFQTIDQLSREKGIDPQIIISAVEDAILAASRKFYKTSEDLQSHFNKETGLVEVFAVKTVVDTLTDPDREMTLADAQKVSPEAAVGSEIRLPKATDVLGRIAAQTAKQVIFQKVREAERDTVYAEYSQRVGEIVNCTVKRTEGPDVILDLGRTEARMPRKEQSRLESYQIGDRIRAAITAVDRAARGPQVILSRADPLLVQKLFEMEVPEIYDGTVVIRAIAREAGERTKAAVFSKDPDVDCVGACVGMKGMRVQSIIRELRGEKIDIIEFSDDISTFAANALSPAKINHVTILDTEQKHLEVIVDDTQLSLAIGKKGQNVRLAARLLGWRIDIKSEEEKRQEIESQMAAMALRGAAVTELQGLGDKTLQKLKDHGVETVEQLAQMTPDELTKIQGIGEKTVDRIRKVVTDYFERDREAAAAAEAAAQETAAAGAVPVEATEVLEVTEPAETPEPEEASEPATGEAVTESETAGKASDSEPAAAEKNSSSEAETAVAPSDDVGEASPLAEEAADVKASEPANGGTEEREGKLE
ncbi:MAG: transcription termination/antitermination protein NusA [Acidobacteria bacterium]|nr:MAG: transcription termination/antitermination protein NusA [Acidobacteriota bacterium]